MNQLIGDAVMNAIKNQQTYQVWKAINFPETPMLVLPMNELPAFKPAMVVATARFVTADVFGTPSVIVHVDDY